jgi:23S rRNA (cytidine1920-2'-O)/16S rRNA (cytidine1409-2'-O)-methyltransferase
MKQRLDNLLVQKKLVATRSQAESYIRLGQVKVEGRVINKPGYFVRSDVDITLGVKTQYVSRAALKLASVTDALGIVFADKTVIDVGSSTGGFTDYALQHRAKKIIAVDVGTDQLHPRLRADEKIELHEKTNILDFTSSEDIDIAVIDVSFVSLQKILRHVATLVHPGGDIIAMMKPQFEAQPEYLHKGIVKNSSYRKKIVQRFELWCRNNGFAIAKKIDSGVSGAKGNVERFYLLRKQQ